MYQVCGQIYRGPKIIFIHHWTKDADYEQILIKQEVSTKTSQSNIYW